MAHFHFASRPQNTQQTAPPRDPRSSGDPRANRSDPRSRDVDTPTKTPPSSAASPPAGDGYSEATFGYANNQEMDAPASPEPERIINCSLAYTGGVPYFLYKITLDVLRPMLPKSINPSDEKYADDPRVQRYGRVGQVAPAEPKMIRPPPQPRARQGSLDNAAELKAKLVDSKMAPGVKDIDPLIPPLSVPEAKVDDSKVKSLPEGLKKPLIPLPKLLDPRLGKQLSLELDKSKPEKSTAALKSPTPSSKPAQPFSHRNDPRFRKKAKIRLSSGSADGDGLQQQLSNEATPVNTDTEQTPEKKPEVDANSEPTVESSHSSDEPADSVISSELLNMTHEQFLAGEVAAMKSERRDNPMEYSTPLGYYAEMNSDDSSYDSYNKPRHSIKKETSSSVTVKDELNMYRSSPTPDAQPGSGITTNPLSVAYNPDAIKTESIYSMSDPAAEEASYVPMKDMFKTIDPTASPFGSIT